jgi:hypothetical protein
MLDFYFRLPATTLPSPTASGSPGRLPP